MTESRKPVASGKVRKTLAGFAFLCTLVALSGCQTIGYYKQAIEGECQILARRQPIQKLMADPGTSPELKEKFQLILELRDFAEKDLRLPVDDQYLRYADLHRPFVVWDVHAAREFSLQPKSWWYPLVGRLNYRGYFSEPGARRYARALEKKDWEVYAEGVQAYSTLGWFKDPLLNTFIFEPESELAEILFHELAHQRLFVSGDTDFNEAFATAVGEEGVRRWLQAKAEPAMYQNYAAALGRNEQFVRLVMATREQLKALYGDDPASDRPPQNRPRNNQDATRLRQQRESIIAQLRRDYAGLKAQWGGLSNYDNWFAKALNNAQLNTVAAYYDLVPGFRALLQKDGGDLEKFFEEVRDLGKLKKKERHRRVKEAENGPKALPGRFVLERDDVVVFTGAANTVAAQQNAHLETLLTLSCAQQNVRFRNLAWEGDTVYEQRREMNFGSWPQQLARVDATVIFAQFGQIESLQGQSSLPKFVQAYQKLLDEFSRQTRRIVLLSPMPFEKPQPPLPDLSLRNDDLGLFVEATRDLAQKRNCLFVDLFTPFRGPSKGGLHLTGDGLHLGPSGHWAMARETHRQLGLGAETQRAQADPVAGALWPETVEQLRMLIQSKNRLWFDYWRPMNWAFLNGDRTEQPSSRDHRNPALRWFPEEMGKFLPLIEAKERDIAALAMKLTK